MEELKLLKAIEQDARISVTDLADILNSEQQQVEATMKKLAEDHIICGYHTVINWDKTNQDHVMALIEVNAYPERDCGYDKVAEKIYRYPEVSNSESPLHALLPRVPPSFLQTNLQVVWTERQRKSAWNCYAN